MAANYLRVTRARVRVELFNSTVTSRSGCVVLICLCLLPMVAEIRSYMRGIISAWGRDNILVITPLLPRIQG